MFMGYHPGTETHPPKQQAHWGPRQQTLLLTSSESRTVHAMDARWLHHAPGPTYSHRRVGTKGARPVELFLRSWSMAMWTGQSMCTWSAPTHMTPTDQWGFVCVRGQSEAFGATHPELRTGTPFLSQARGADGMGWENVQRLTGT